MRRLLLGLVVAVATLVPNLANGDDQTIARHIMSKLQLEQQRGALKGFHIDMRVDRGTVWYKGFVTNQYQKNMILRIAQQAKRLGVVQVVDDISVRQQQQPVYQYQAPQPMAQQPELQQTGYMQYDVAVPQAGANIPSPQQQPRSIRPIRTRQMATPVSGQPLPMARSGAAPMPAAGDSPSVPGYAWPSYAPHPNYAAATYPQQYAPSAWPYIGPFYPYPQVPLGWRKVTLEWDDGWWWLDFHNR